jgi:hypothetical protein
MNEPAMPWPEDTVQLDTDKAVQVIMTGGHTDAFRPGGQNAVIDLMLVKMVRHGYAVMGIGPGGQLEIQATAKAMIEDGHILIDGRWVKRE